MMGPWINLKLDWLLKDTLKRKTLFDTFAHVTRIASIRVLFALASIHKLMIHQMDIKTTFLNRELEEKIYMEQPEGCVTKKNEHKV